jgi:hypothetical protein
MSIDEPLHFLNVLSAMAALRLPGADADDLAGLSSVPSAELDEPASVLQVCGWFYDRP